MSQSRFAVGASLLVATLFVLGCARAESPVVVDVGEPLVGQIVVDRSHPAWLAREGVGSLFICGPGDPEGFLYRGRRRGDGTRDGDQLALIEKLGDSGANSIYLMAVRSHGGDGDRTHNPFVDSDPERGLNERLLDQWEEWFSEMDRRGIVIFFIFYDDSSRIWNTGDEVEEPEGAFVRELVNRFKHHRNLIWVVAEEYQERYSAKRVSRIAAEIRASDEHHHPIAVHKLNGLSFREFANDPAIDQFAIQYNVATAKKIRDGVTRAWRSAAGRYNLNLAEAEGWGSGSEARQKAWAAALGGAYVMVLGMDIQSTPTSDLEDCGRLVRFMEGTEFAAMAPRDNLAAGEILYVLAHPGEAYIGYAPVGGGALGFEDLRAGDWRLRWLDLASGEEVTTHVTVDDDGDAVWPRPDGIGAEVALSAERLSATAALP